MRTHVLYSGAEANLAVALYGLSVQISYLMVFTVHGIVPPLCCMYFLGLCPRKYIQPSHGTYPIRRKNHETTTCITYMYTHEEVWYVPRGVQYGKACAIKDITPHRSTNTCLNYWCTCQVMCTFTSLVRMVQRSYVELLHRRRESP